MEPARAHHINDDIIIGLNHHKYQHICSVCLEEILHFHSAGQLAFNILIQLECMAELHIGLNEAEQMNTLIH